MDYLGHDVLQRVASGQTGGSVDFAEKAAKELLKLRGIEGDPPNVKLLRGLASRFEIDAAIDGAGALAPGLKRAAFVLDELAEGRSGQGS